jgi:hypothetical protein
MPYIYRVSRREPPRQPQKAGVPISAPQPEPVPELEEPEPSYRELQGQAKELGISAKQTADDLKKAIEEASNE